MIFGATGNLSHYKLLPALYHLEAGWHLHLHPQIRILNFGRRPWSDAQWRAEVQGILAAHVLGAPDTSVLARLQERLHFVADDLEAPDGWTGACAKRSSSRPTGSSISRWYRCTIPSRRSS